jgi:hypothetical protein
MSALLIVDGRECWEHAQTLARHLSSNIPCRVLQDSSLPLILGLHNVSSVRADEESLAGFFEGCDARYLIVFTRRQGVGSLTRLALEVSWKFESTYVLQEYWGDIIDEDLPAGVVLQYLVRDDFAATLTKSRTKNSHAHVVGCPRYGPYEAWDLPAIKKDVRDCLGVPPNQQLIGWFGQSPDVADAYRRTLEKFVRTVASRPLLKVLYRPHIRESADQIQFTESTLRQSGVAFVTVLGEETLRCLCAVDVVATVFSNCVADAIHLNRISPVPLNTSIYFLFDAEMVNYHFHHTQLLCPPLASQQAALIVTNEDDLAACLDRAFDSAQLLAVWQRATSIATLGSESLTRISAYMDENRRSIHG